MNVLFAGGNGYYPEFHGGVQSSTHHLVEQLRGRGHEAAVLASLFGDGIFGMTARRKARLPWPDASNLNWRNCGPPHDGRRLQSRRIEPGVEYWNRI
jgi:hypothetical protein